MDNSTRYGLLGDARRLGEILAVANKHKLAQGMTPEKLCSAFKDLGTAFIKIGQLLSLHPEVLPKEYCKALSELRNDAPTINASQIRDIISAEYGKPWNTVFSKITGIPVGAASIAQVHEAFLLDGTRVAIKIQRPDSYQMMEQDCRLLRKAINVLRISQIRDMMWVLDGAISEVWRVAQEELDFIQEAKNLDRMAEILEPMEFAYVPRSYPELTTKDVLVMEYIDGIELTDHEGLIAAGYDIKEVCQKLIRSYIKQWAEDMFFQADPHSGNIRIRDGQVVWLDLGMTGRLTEDEAEALHHCMHAIWKNDVVEFTEWGLFFAGFPKDHPAKYDLQYDFTEYLNKYRTQTIKEMNETGDVFVDMFKIMRKYGAEFPMSLVMYGRSLLVMEGTVSDLDENTDLAQILGKHLAAYAIGAGPAGKIARKLSHNRLCSGSRLRYNENQEEEKELSDEELLSAEEYQLLQEDGSLSWVSETHPRDNP